MASQSALRDSFLKAHPLLRFGLGEWRQYTEGIWAPVSELVVQSHVQTLIQQNGTRLSQALVTSVGSLLKAKTYLPDQLFDANSDVVTFNNCCLDLNTYQTIPHSPDYYSTLKLNFDYDPTARSEAWERATRSFPYPNVLQRFAGLSLTTDTKYEVALWLHGPPGGGKSTFIGGLESMLGPKCCTLGLIDIERSRFGLSQLPGKTLAVSTEQPSAFVKCAHLLNSIISGEPITIEKKYSHSFTTSPKIKLLWAMNELPQIPSGAGAGLFRRVYPVYWPAIDEADRDVELKEEILRSPMAVANWALPGLKELRQAQRFEIPEELVLARNAYREESDLTRCFLNDCYYEDETGEIPSSTLYDTYQTWCTKNGHKQLASNRLAAEMQRLGFDKVKRNIGNFWLGLCVKSDFPDFVVDDDSS